MPMQPRSPGRPEGEQHVENAFIVLPNGKIYARFGENDGAVPLADYPAKTGFRFKGGDLLQTQQILWMASRSASCT